MDVNIATNIEHLQDKLHNYVYWNTVIPEKWELTQYDLSLCKEGLITKCAAHTLLLNDVKLLKEHTAPHIAKCANRVAAQLKSCKSDSINTYFWKKTAPSLAQAHLDTIPAEKNLEVALINSAAKVLDDRNNVRKVSETFSDSNSNKKQKYDVSNRVEYDEVYFGDMDSSVGTTIKTAAFNLHNTFVKGKNSLTPQERRIMSNGLSSILDIVDMSSQGQRCLFNSSDWDELVNFFSTSLSLEAISIESLLTNNFMILNDTIRRSLSINTGLVYLFKAYPRSLSTGLFNSLRIYEHTLELLKKYSHLLSKKSPKNCTEEDYLSLVWSRYFELLFDSTSVRVKRGESTTDHSSDNKKELYPDENHVISFKIDIRFLVDYDKKEYDVACGEIAKHDGEKKIIDDEGKLCREAKDIVDNLLEKLPFEMSKSCVGWSVQLAGASCLISSIHLAKNGLYVNMPRGDFLLPATIVDFSDFNSTVMPVLMLFKKEVLSIADKLLLVLNEKTNVKGPLRRTKSNSTNYMSYYQRDTWYTPPCHSQSQIPSNLFGFPPPPSILQKIMALSYEATETGENAGKAFVDASKDGYDEFGFKKVENGYYNRVTDSVWDSHPHQEEPGN